MVGTAARKVALQVLIALEQEDAWLQQVVEARARDARLDPRDRGLALELSAGITRWRRMLDHVLAGFVSRGLEETPMEVLQALRLGLYQLRRLDRIPDHAAIHATVDLAREAIDEGVAGFVNGVLRAIQRAGDDAMQVPPGDDVTAVAVRSSHPDWLVARWLDALGLEATEALCEAHNTPAPLVLRAEGPALGRADLVARLTRDGAKVKPGRHTPESVEVEHFEKPFASESFRDGWWIAQDEGSQLPALLLQPEPGHQVWDACAAPGGKSLQIARMMGLVAEGHPSGTRRGRLGTGEESSLWCTDTHPNKARMLAQRMGTRPGVEVDRHDATRTPDRMFDRILVDAPCSSLGLLRRHPEIRWRRTEADLARLSDQQLRILTAAAAALKPDGVMVYSVCSLTDEEGPGVIERFLEAHPDFQRLPPPEGTEVDWSALTDEHGQVRTWPHVHHCDGFFAVRLGRKA